MILNSLFIILACFKNVFCQDILEPYPVGKNFCDNEGVCFTVNGKQIICKCDSGFTGVFIFK